MSPNVDDGVEVAARFTMRWRELVAAVPGNPLAVEIAEVGGATAVAAGGDLESPWFNVALGVSEAGTSAVAPLAAWARQRNVRLTVEVPARPGSQALIDALLAGGAVEADPIDLLLGPIRPAEPATVDLHVVSPGSAEAALFAATLALGHGAPEERPAAMDAAAAAFADQPGWTCLLAMVDGQPAGASVLTVDGEIGYLANASVLPAERGRGLQTAMIAQRSKLAEMAGCRTLVSLALPGGSSHRNLERAGLTVACTLRTFELG